MRETSRKIKLGEGRRLLWTEEERRQRKGRGLIFPFSVAEYETTCPNGHPVTLSTGYSTFAPDWWKQWGVCQVCGRSVERTVGFRRGKFLAGPIHWVGEKIEEEKIWSHDVLSVHRCERCRQLAKEELAQALLAEIGAKGEHFQRADFTEADIVGFLEELTA